MNRRFADMQTNVGNNVQDTSSPTQTIIKRFINDTYRDMLRRYNWDFYNHDYTITTVAGTQDYELPRDFGKELSVMDDTNDTELSYIPYQKLLRDYSSTWDGAGTPERYSILEKRVVNQPSSASVITVVSDDNSDTSQVLYVRGIIDGVEQTNSVTLTGTTPAATTDSYTRIISLAFSTPRVGKVTVTSNAAAVTNATIGPETIDYKVRCVRFHFVPNSGVVIKMPYKINPITLEDDNDVPLLPADIIEQGATAHTWRYKRQMAKAQEYERIYEKGIINNIWDQENQLNQPKFLDIRPYSRETTD